LSKFILSFKQQRSTTSSLIGVIAQERLTAFMFHLWKIQNILWITQEFAPVKSKRLN